MPNDTGEENLEDKQPGFKIDDIDPESATAEQVEQLKKTAQTALAQKSHWKEKAIDPETGKPYKELLSEKERESSAHQPDKQAPPATETPTELETRLKNLEAVEEKRKFGFTNGMSPEEVDHLFAYAQGVGMKPADAMQTPFMKAGLKAFKEENRTASAIPGPSSRSPVVEGKRFGEMKPDEQKKNFSKVVEAFTKT
jgi:hypothetical protein